MVNLIKPPDNELNEPIATTKSKLYFTAWALSVAILIISILATSLSYISIGLIKDFRNEFLSAMVKNEDHHQRVNLCVKELQMNQGDRLQREGKPGIKETIR